MKSKELKRREAKRRQRFYDNLSASQKLLNVFRKIDEGKGSCERELEKLAAVGNSGYKIDNQ